MNNKVYSVTSPDENVTGMWCIVSTTYINGKKKITQGICLLANESLAHCLVDILNEHPLSDIAK